MKIKRKLVGDVAVVQLSGNVMGGEGYEELRDEIWQLVRGGYVDVVLNLRGAKWINSQGVGSIVAAHSSLLKEGGRLKVCSIPERVWTVFVITQIHKIVEVYKTEAEALKSFAAG